MNQLRRKTFHSRVRPDPTSGAVSNLTEEAQTFEVVHLAHFDFMSDGELCKSSFGTPPALVFFLFKNQMTKKLKKLFSLICNQLGCKSWQKLEEKG